MALIIVKQRGLETRSLFLPEGKLTVGRSSKNDIVVSNRYVSTRHCELVFEKGECTVIDLDSKNGLFVNGTKVTNRKLEDGDRILVGAAMFIYIANEEAVQVDKLTARLQLGTPGERELAANLLGQLGSPAVMGPLLATLKTDPEPKVKAAAAEALGLLGDSSVIKPLIAHFDTDDPVLRNSVVRSIIRVADDKAVEGVAGFLKHEDKKVRVLAAYTLGQTHNVRAVKHLKKALDDEAFAVREAVIKALGDLEDPKASEILMEAAKDHLRFPRVWVMESLGRIRNPDAVPTVVEALKDPDPEVREAAAYALGKLRVKETIPSLIAAIDDADPTVQRAVVKSLEKLRRHIEVERKLTGRSGEGASTMEIATIGDRDTHESSVQLFGGDRGRWEKWWSEQSPADRGRGKK